VGRFARRGAVVLSHSTAFTPAFCTEIQILCDVQSRQREDCLEAVRHVVAVRFEGWQSTHEGDRLLQSSLRKPLT
jgi:hypothetical protein